MGNLKLKGRAQNPDEKPHTNELCTLCKATLTRIHWNTTVDILFCATSGCAKWHQPAGCSKSKWGGGVIVARSLYQCGNARVFSAIIYCLAGHDLNPHNKGCSSIHIRQLERGDQLALKVCHDCVDFDDMGLPVRKEDRGWVDIKVVEAGI